MQRSARPTFFGSKFCFNARPHLNPLPPGRGLSLIVVRDGLIAGAFIQSKPVVTEHREPNGAGRTAIGQMTRTAPAKEIIVAGKSLTPCGFVIILSASVDLTDS